MSRNLSSNGSFSLDLSYTKVFSRVMKSSTFSIVNLESSFVLPFEDLFEISESSVKGKFTPWKCCTTSLRMASRCFVSAILFSCCCVVSCSSFPIALLMFSTCFCNIAFCSSNSLACFRSCFNSASLAYKENSFTVKKNLSTPIFY